MSDCDLDGCVEMSDGNDLDHGPLLGCSALEREESDERWRETGVTGAA
ncbi:MULTISPECIES: hypothetical protein [Sorangium]|nr:hypothetical protein [Sorangium cellulosum]